MEQELERLDEQMAKRRARATDLLLLHVDFADQLLGSTSRA